MKQYAKFILLCIALFSAVCFISCGGSVGKKQAEAETAPAALVTIQYESEAKTLSKALQTVIVRLAQTIIDDSNYGEIKKEVEGRKVTSLAFTSVTEIKAIFSDVATTLKTISADGNLKKIDYSVFEKCVHLTLVELKSEVQVQYNSFPPTNTATFKMPQKYVNTYQDYFPTANFEIFYFLNINLNNTNYANLRNAKIGKNKYTIQMRETLESVNVPTADNAAFLGFYKEAKTSQTQVFDKDGKTLKSVSGFTDENGRWIANADTTVYAHWKVRRDAVTLTFDLNNSVYSGVENATLSKKTVTQNVDKTASAVSVPEADNAFFLGFYKDADTTATQLFDKDGKPVKNTDEIIDKEGIWISEEDLTLYAHWKVGKKLTLDLNTDFYQNLSKPVLKDNSIIVIPNEKAETVTTPTSENAEFLGFYTDSSATDILVISKDGEVQSDVENITDENGNWILTENTTVYARWKIKKGITINGFTDIVIHFDPNRTYGINVNEMVQSSISIGETSVSVSDKPTNPTDENLVVEGYYADKDFKTKLFKSDGSVVSGDVENYVSNGKWDCIFGRMEIYAKWSKTVTITLNKNGGITDGVAIVFIGSPTLESITHAVYDNNKTKVVDYYGTETAINSGDVIIDSDGTFRVSTGEKPNPYLDEKNCWKGIEDITLYAQYTEDADIKINN